MTKDKYKRLWNRAYEQLAKQDELLARYRRERDEARAEVDELRAKVAAMTPFVQPLADAWGEDPPHEDLDRCPFCKGTADNGHDRGYPPSPYACTKCEEATK